MYDFVLNNTVALQRASYSSRTLTNHATTQDFVVVV